MKRQPATKSRAGSHPCDFDRCEWAGGFRHSYSTLGTRNREAEKQVRPGGECKQSRVRSKGFHTSRAGGRTKRIESPIHKHKGVANQRKMSAIFDFSSLLTVILLLICTTAFVREIRPGIYDGGRVRSVA